MGMFETDAKKHFQNDLEAVIINILDTLRISCNKKKEKSRLKYKKNINDFLSNFVVNK